MESQRFDDLTRSLARSRSRRSVLKGLAGLMTGGLLAQIQAGLASAAPKQGNPKHCRAEGKTSKDPSHCCSGTAAGSVCCGVENGSCAATGCCSDASGQFCYNGTCVSCVPEGEAPPDGDPILCCSFEANDGRCCGTEGGSCQASGCCSGATPYCLNGACSDCAPDGELVLDASQCCSHIASNDVCCTPEGFAVDNPRFCCSGRTDADGTCCGQIGGSCAASGCCPDGFTCCKEKCVPVCPSPETLNPDTCLCELPCHFPGATCSADNECCSGSCCNGVCADTQTDPTHCGACSQHCSLGEECHAGLCVYTCGDTFCPHLDLCFAVGGAPVTHTCCPRCGLGLCAYTCGDGACCCGPLGALGNCVATCDGFTTVC